MHGGTITQRPPVHASASSASYWMSSISSLRKTTLPGVIARLRPDLEGALVAHRDAALARVGDAGWRSPARGSRPRSASARREHLGVGRREIGRRHRVDVLARHELEPVLVVLGQRGQRGELGQVLGGQQVALLQQREVRQLAPLARGEARSPAGGATTSGSVAGPRAPERRPRWRPPTARAQPRLEAVVERDHGARIDHRGRERGRQVQARRRRERGEVRHREPASAGGTSSVGCVHHLAHSAAISRHARQVACDGISSGEGSAARFTAREGVGNGARRARGPGVRRRHEVAMTWASRCAQSAAADGGAGSLRVAFRPGRQPPCTSSSSPGSS